MIWIKLYDFTAHETSDKLNRRLPDICDDCGFEVVSFTVQGIGSIATMCTRIDLELDARFRRSTYTLYYLFYKSRLNVHVHRITRRVMWVTDMAKCNVLEFILYIVHMICTVYLKLYWGVICFHQKINKK